LGDGSHKYSYDAENRLQYVDSGSTATYIYDALGHRVGKSMPSGNTYYIFDSKGQVVSKRDAKNNWVQTQIRFAGNLIAYYSVSSTGFYLQDHLGSTRLVTLQNGTVSDSLDFLPFGVQIAGGTTTDFKFTSKERDPESATVPGGLDGLDYFGARYYSWNLGRWMSPDKKMMSVRHLINPQKWNRYGYVQNNPMSFLDPDGLDDWYVFRPLADSPGNGGNWFFAVLWAQLRGDNVILYNGADATVQAFAAASSTPGAHVLFVGHADVDEKTGQAVGIEVANGEFYGKNGSEASPTMTQSDSGITTNVSASSSNTIAADEIALFGCNSAALAYEYPLTSFVGINNPTGEVSQYYADAAAADFLAAGGGQPGGNAANLALWKSTLPIDAMATVNIENTGPPVLLPPVLLPDPPEDGQAPPEE
jgi:RHS repeat-associated protein